MKRNSFFLFLLLILIMGISLFIGRYPEPYFTPIRILSTDRLAQQLLLRIRMPRILAAAVLGASLAAAGQVFQTAFKNPIADGGILGVNQAAGFGAAVAIILANGNGFIIQITALICGLLSLALVLGLSNAIKTGNPIIDQIFAGIAISAVFSSGIGIIKYLADPLQELPSIVFWLLGDISTITWDKLSFVLPQVLIGILILLAYRWRLNALSMDESVSLSLDAGNRNERFFLLFIAVMISASVISFAGLVGWIGIIIPNLSRTLFGSATQKSLPNTMLIGAMFTVVCDTLARSLIAGEIPLGILTALVGALLMVILLRTGNIVLQKKA